MLDGPPALARTGSRMKFSAARARDWLSFDRHDVGLAFTLSVVAIVINTSGAFRFLSKLSLLEWAQWFGNGLLGGTLTFCVLVAALKASERLSIQGWRRHLVTVLIGMTVPTVTSVPEIVFEWPQASAALRYGIASSPFAFLLYVVWLNVALTLVARAWLVESREATHASKLLARIRSEQMSVRRRLVEGRLKAIQARVDPRFFFEMLDAVQTTYTTNVARAEQLLDELTAFLRAALPRLWTASSTVAQECELARSFARLRVLAGGGKFEIDIDIVQAIGTARFPPGVLLPLVDELLRATANADGVRISFSTQPAATVTDWPATSISVEAGPRTLVMALTAQTNPSMAASTGERIPLHARGATADARATLLDLFGAKADLTSIAIDGGVQTTVRIPYEPAST